MNKFKNKKGGISILGILFLTIILILVLSYFNISIKSVVNSPTGKDNIEYVGGGTKNLWDKYLKEPVNYFWNEIAIKIFWKAFINNMEHIRDGKPTDFQNASPKINPY